MESNFIKTASLIEFPIFQLGFSDLLKRVSSVSNLGNFDKSTILEQIHKHSPDILFINLKEDCETMELIKKLRGERLKTKLAVFLNSLEKSSFKTYMDLGVQGLLMKSIDRMELQYALQVICRGGLFVSQEISSEVFNSLVCKQPDGINERVKKYHLTPREIEILLMVFQEYSNHEIALRLKISPRTVEAHRNNILNKTRVKNSIGLAKFVIEHKLNRQTVNV